MSDKQTQEILTLFSIFQAADIAWHEELEHEFGTRAGDMRYVAQGRTGPTLAPLYEARMAAMRAWEAAKKEPRS